MDIDARLLSSHDHDTRLARLLHAKGRADLGQLQQALAEVREGRSDRGAPTLAQSLVVRGVISQQEAGEYLTLVAGKEGPQRVQQAWLPGGLVGSCVIVEELGRGAMGVVYKASHLATGAPCAIKALPLEHSDDEMIARFEREGEAQARVDGHPNVVRVHSAGRAEGCSYLIQDLATGGDLEQRLRRGTLPPAEAAALVRQLAEGMAHVHAQGVLHRDLKPSNVIFDERGIPKLVDFGLARFEGRDSLTQSGTVLGTPSYMAPEQVEGLRGICDERTDVYGLGAVLYHVLCGEPPFEGKSTIDTLSRVLTDDPIPPSKRKEGLPAALDRVTLKALAKDPQDRYPNAQALADDLGSFLGGEGVSAPSLGGRGRFLGMVAAMAILAGAIGAFLLGEPEDPHPQPDVSPAASLPSDPTPSASTAANPAAPALEWKLRAGDDYRCSFAMTETWNTKMGNLPRNKGTRETVLEYLWQIQAVENGRASSLVTMETFTVPVGSRRGVGKVKPGMGLFSILFETKYPSVMDVHTGEVISFGGLEPVYDQVKKVYMGKEGFFDGIKSSERMCYYLNKGFNALPDEGRIPPKGKWDRTRAIVVPTAFTRRAGAAEVDLPIKFTIKTVKKGTYAITWRGEQGDLELEGWAKFDGVLRVVESTETWRSDNPHRNFFQRTYEIKVTR